jgi:predicted RNase H-like nuclease
MERVPNCVGVDGAKSGWIAVWSASTELRFCVYGSARSLVDSHRQARVIAVDIPIGLPERDGRRADNEARRFVGGRRASSVFSSPVRGILDAATQPEASRRHREIDGRGFGAQSFGILPKIREWDELLQSDAKLREVVREVHPEVSFSALNGGIGKGLAFKKKSQEGAVIRTALVSAVFGSENVAQLLQSVPRPQAATDDVLDALAALWSAERIASGKSSCLPTPPDSDATGLTTAIWY